MVSELKKYKSFGEVSEKGKSSKYQSPRNAFLFYLNEDIIKIVGKNLIITKPSYNSFMLSASNLDSKTKPVKLGKHNTLRIPHKLVDEWLDLGIYEIDIDDENECVYLNKI